MDNAGLNQRLRKGGADRLRKSLEAVDDGDQDVCNAAILQIVHNLETELGALGLLDPKPQNLLLAGRLDAQDDIDRLVLDQALVADFDPQRVKKDDRINRLKRPALPFAHLIQNGVGDLADQIGRDLRAVELGQVALDL